MLFNRHESCFGMTLFRCGQRRAEIWFCMPGYEIQEHVHMREDVELMFLFGSGTTFYRRPITTGIAEWFSPRWWNIFRCFSVKSSDSHWFSVSRWPLVFINFQRFHKGFTPASAAIDFTPTFMQRDVAKSIEKYYSYGTKSK